ncbi:mucoidy inhibitor MuiA family protein [Salinarimonas soli]|uniref:Mucoidy inhibitor MuiA family protein n=1 Tax=Salinarimonas soli TaxID=1638099 RepID=A0A5B2VEH4_9HYPH|nr:mucoidy inhibitor MuiA family protein [Salinarimonas soli]KAA2236759.1 mucoidy inhibitor MuiA family protein [Salinarimonas soli]
MRVRVALFLLLAPGPVSAAEIELPSRVDRVTVFPDAAQVTRTAVLDLPPGASTLLLRGLPAGLDPDSIRVTGVGGGALAIGAVDVRAVPGDLNPALDRDLERRLQALRDEREAVAGRVAALEVKRAAIETYAKASPEKLSPEARPLDVAQWPLAWDAIGAGLAAVNEDIRVAGVRARDLEAEIAALEGARSRPIRPGAPKRDVTVAVEAGAALKGALEVTYRIAGAAWTPAYDARLDLRDKPALELVRRAGVRQRTGEDWSDVVLQVSTVRARGGAAAPDLPPIQAQIEERPQPLARSTMAAPAPKLQAEADAVAARQVEATLESGPFQATFTVPGRVSVAGDGATKTLVLSRQAHAPALLARAVPVLDETAYLEASFVHREDAPLLPGEVAVTRDGTFVGRTRLKLTAPGETVALGFGIDDRVKVTRVPLSRREGETGWIGTARTDQREFKTTVRNLHPMPLRIIVQDRLPFSENAALTIEALRENTPPTERQVDDRRGVMGWTWDYAPGEAREIRFGYRLRWPSDKEITFEPRPVPGG